MSQNRRAGIQRGWQRMLSGRRLEILDPSPLDVELDDIAHGLARVARWNGQTHGLFPFSVAQHSCLVEAIAEEFEPAIGADQRLHLLLHDASEYVVGDVVTPLKAALGTGFREIEDRLQAAILMAFGLSATPSQSLRHLTKRADRSAAWLEATRLAGFSEHEAQLTFGNAETVSARVAPLVDPWPTETAQMRFRARVEHCLASKQSGHPGLL